MVSKLDSAKILYSEGNNDECYTPAYSVQPILEYIPKDAIVWCPFDTPDSEFVKLISKQNIVTSSHLDEGLDFFDYDSGNNPIRGSDKKTNGFLPKKIQCYSCFHLGFPPIPKCADA